MGAVGPPGRRQFFLRATGQGTSIVLYCEKFHVQGLVVRMRQLLEAQELDPEAEAPAPEGEAEPVAADWTIGELGLGYHESKRRFVIVAREAPENEDQDVATLATARFWVSPEQVRAFTRQAERVLAQGRPLCPFCGLPVDPSGHPCPAANGSRPIV